MKDFIVKLASSYKKDLDKAVDHVRHLVKTQGNPYPLAISLAADSFDVDQGDISRVLNPVKKAIKWIKPNLIEEVGEYFENPTTKKYLSGLGYLFSSEKDLINFLATGKMKEITKNKIVSIENLTIDDQEFQKEIDDKYKSMRKELQDKVKISLPAPILLNLDDQYYLFAGNRRVNLATRNNLPIKFWVVEIKNQNPQQQKLF